MENHQGITKKQKQEMLDEIVNDKRKEDIVEDPENYAEISRHLFPLSKDLGVIYPQTLSNPLTIYLDGKSLKIEHLCMIGLYTNVLVDLTAEAWTRVEEGRAVVDNIVNSGKVVYGITTGFGSFSSVTVSADKLSELQYNLIRSHAAGVGNPLTPERTRRMLALRINVLAKGRSGIRPETLKKLIKACNAWCLSYIPEKGTLGASGDLAPLSHLALGLMGEGKMWNMKNSSWGNAADILKEAEIEPITLMAKEGLALINGTQFISSLGAEAVHRSEVLCLTADVAGALSLEALKGTKVAFSPIVHAERPHAGQNLVAGRLRALLDSQTHPSEIADSHRNCSAVQDAYTLRCMPQVHGVVNDTVKNVRDVLETEMNSATDNPMVFAETNQIISAGNFHGEYPAKNLDYLAIAVAELASISERRIERLVNTDLSRLPPFLVPSGGLNSGFMIAHCTASALVSENKTLAHPSSVDSISTSAAKEDHVSMGGWAARKALSIVENVENVIAIEILAAVQGIDFLRPLKTTDMLERVIKLVRDQVPFYEKDRFLAPDIEAVAKMVRTGQIAKVAFESFLPEVD